MLFTAYILTMAIMMLPAGIFASRFGDKRMMTIGLAIVTVFAFICGISQTIAQLSLFRAGWGLGNAMFFATAMTLLIALSKEVHEAVGLYEAAIGLGMAGGPLLGGILGGHSWRYPFFATSILIFLAFILVFFFVKEPERKVKRKAAGVGELLNLVKYKPFMQGAISGMLYYYGFFVVLAYSPLIMHLSAIQLILYDTPLADPIAEAKNRDATGLHPNFQLLTKEFVQLAQKQGYVFRPYTINCSIRISIRIK